MIDADMVVSLWHIFHNTYNKQYRCDAPICLPIHTIFCWSYFSALEIDPLLSFPSLVLSFLSKDNSDASTVTKKFSYNQK